MSARQLAFPLLLAIPFVVGSLATAQDQDAATSDERLREAWSYLLPEEQAEVGEWYRAEVGYLDTYQNRMIAYVIDAEETDRGTWPQAGPRPFFDPVRHCPAQPIPRKWLDANSRRAQDALKTFKPAKFADPLWKTWSYDWSNGQIVAHGDERNPQVLFENALQGLPPLIDLAEALLLRRLDDGSQRVALTAFEHAYTDRSGNVYPGISLYDAWCSGTEFEMPDVDNLGIMHSVYNDWKSYTAPVPGTLQTKLYAKVGEAFVDAKHHRQLREAVAANYLRGSAVPKDIYSSSSLSFNALWQEYASVPETFAENLPDAKYWKKYIEKLTKRTNEREFVEAGKNRIAWIDGERARVRATLVRVLEEFGAMKRKKRPEPEPPEPAKPPREEPK